MKAAILVKQNKPLVVTQLDIPKELKYGQVLVKVLYSTICGAQINEFLGTKGPDKFLPHLLGHEGSGIVDECGPGVTNVKKGDKVVPLLEQKPSYFKKESRCIPSPDS